MFQTYLMSFLFNRIFGNYGEGQYVGDEASEWFSNYLNKPGCRLYKLTKPRLVIESKDGADCARPDDKVGQESLHLCCLCCLWMPFFTSIIVQHYYDLAIQHLTLPLHY